MFEAHIFNVIINFIAILATGGFGYVLYKTKAKDQRIDDLEKRVSSLDVKVAVIESTLNSININTECIKEQLITLNRDLFIKGSK